MLYEKFFYFYLFYFFLGGGMSVYVKQIIWGLPKHLSLSIISCYMKKKKICVWGVSVYIKQII